MPFYFALAWRLDYFSQTISAKGIPTKQEINGLPRRAMAVFAARCARRVLPLALRLTMLSETQKQAVEAAASWAEAAADDSARPDRENGTYIRPNLRRCEIVRRTWRFGRSRNSWRGALRR